MTSHARDERIFLATVTAVTFGWIMTGLYLVIR
jgi:hypothetical protein